jgi:prevent-host-death family protein
MPDIRPITELRSNTSSIISDIQKTGGPIFFTTNGRGVAVMMSNKKYDELTGENPALYEPFGTCVTYLREIKNLTAKDLATQSGLSEDYLSGLERGITCPTDKDITSLATALDVKPETLSAFAGSEEVSQETKSLLLKILGKIADVSE